MPLAQPQEEVPLPKESESVPTPGRDELGDLITVLGQQALGRVCDCIHDNPVVVHPTELATIERKLRLYQ